LRRTAVDAVTPSMRRSTRFRFSRTCLEPIFTKMHLKSENRRNAHDRLIFASRTQDYLCARVKIRFAVIFRYSPFSPLRGTGLRCRLRPALSGPGGTQPKSRVRPHAVIKPTRCSLAQRQAVRGKVPTVPDQQPRSTASLFFMRDVSWNPRPTRWYRRMPFLELRRRRPTALHPLMLFLMASLQTK